MYVILVYDISLDDKGQKVLNKVFKMCKKYLNHIQNSVFEGELTEAQIIELKGKMNRFIREEKDSVIIFKSRQKGWLEKEMLGKTEDKTSNFL